MLERDDVELSDADLDGVVGGHGKKRGHHKGKGHHKGRGRGHHKGRGRGHHKHDHTDPDAPDDDDDTGGCPTPPFCG